MNTNDLSRQHNKASNGILASKCQLIAVFIGECRQITIVCTDFCKIPNALLFGKRNSVLSKFNTDWCSWCCVAFTYVLFLDRKIDDNVTEIPSRSDQNYEEKPYFGP